MYMHPKYMTGKVCLFGNANQDLIQTGSDKPYQADQIEKQGESFATCYLGPSSINQRVINLYFLVRKVGMEIGMISFFTH